MKTATFTAALFLASLGLSNAADMPLATVTLPATYAKKADVQRCGGTPTMTFDAVLTTVSCLEAKGHYVTARRLIYLAKDVAETARGNALRQGNPNEALRESEPYERLYSYFSDVDARLWKENDEHPQVPDILELAPQSCEGQTLTRYQQEHPDWVTLYPEYEDDPLNDAASTALKQSQGDIANCYFQRKDWSSVVRIFKTFDLDQIIQYGEASYEWHLAIAFDKIGDRKRAKLHIRKSYNTIMPDIDMNGNRVYNSKMEKQIAYDYNRLGAAKEDTRSLDASFNHFIQQAKVDARSYAANYTGDMHDVALANGVPCHTEEYHGSGYDEVTWWYCAGDDYSRAFTFINGHLHSEFIP